MAREIILAESMGYCWGVRRTLDIIQKADARSRPVATIGDVIHNPNVVEQLRTQGIDTAQSIDEADGRGFQRVAITAHGAAPDRAEEVLRRGMEVIDTTCPLVTKVQRLAEKLVRQGYFIVVYGDGTHPEVKGILGWAGTIRAVAAMHVEDLPWNTARGTPGADRSEMPPRKVAVISQTTKNTSGFLKFAQCVFELAAAQDGEVRICNTICEPTVERQNALHDLVSQVDVILVVGGKKSSNTARLAEVGRSHGVPSHHIEDASEIDQDWLHGIERVGVTAGASTPDEVIVSIINELQNRGFTGPPRPFRAESLEAVPAY